MPFVATPSYYFSTPTTSVQVGFGGDYNFRLDPNQKGGDIFDMQGMTRRRKRISRRRGPVATVRLAVGKQGLLGKRRQRGCGGRQRSGIGPFAAMALAPLATQLAVPLVQNLAMCLFGGG